MREYTCLLVIIVFFVSFSVVGQKHVFDSLSRELDLKFSTKKNEKEKIKQLYLFCRDNATNAEMGVYKYYIDNLTTKAKENKEYDYILLAKILLSEKHKKNGNQEEAISTIDKFYKIYKNNISDSLKVMCFNQKALVYNFLNETDSARVYYKKTIDLGKKLNQKKALGYAYDGLSSLYMNARNYKESISYTHKSLQIAKNYEIHDLIVRNYLNLGNLYIQIENYDKSLLYLSKAIDKLKMNRNINQELRCEVFRFMGLNYSRNGNIKKANEYNNKAISCYESFGNVLLASDVLNTIGANYLRAGKFKEAVPYFENLIANAKRIDNKWMLNYGFINLSSAYIETNQLIKGEKLLLNVLKDTIDNEFFAKNLEKVAYQNLSDLYNRRTNYKLSLFYHKKFKHLEDSLYTVKSRSEATEIDTKYQTELKEKENFQLKAEKAIQAQLLATESKRKWQLGSGLVASLLALAIFSFYYRRNQKQKEVIENLQKELHHRVKNNLAIIDTFIEVTKDELNDEKVDVKLTELQNRIESINEVHKQLYAGNELSNLNLNEYICKISSNVQRSFNDELVVIQQYIDEKLSISPEKSFPLGLIVNEFITNSYKYAFKDRNGSIEIKIESVGTKIKVALADNGVGLKDDFEISKATTFGIRIMKLLTEQLKGDFYLHNENGVKLIIEFPK